MRALEMRGRQSLKSAWVTRGWDVTVYHAKVWDVWAVLEPRGMRAFYVQLKRISTMAAKQQQNSNILKAKFRNFQGDYVHIWIASIYAGRTRNQETCISRHPKLHIAFHHHHQVQDTWFLHCFLHQYTWTSLYLEVWMSLKWDMHMQFSLRCHLPSWPETCRELQEIWWLFGRETVRIWRFEKGQHIWGWYDRQHFIHFQLSWRRCNERLPSRPMLSSVSFSDR